ncbi:ABC transporter permease [Roseateles aquatilis]|nr:ABC-2 family transporter protein [Roseateles aquatilis]
MRHLQILRAMAILAFKRAGQYRSDFFLEGASTLLVVAVQLIPVAVLYGEREQVAGWRYGEMLVLLGWFLMMRCVLDGVIAPSLAQTIGGIRTGHFDYVLMKPVDAMFLCSLGHMRPWQAVRGAAGIALMGMGFAALRTSPSLAAVALATVLSGAALLTLYSIFILCVAGSFLVVRVQNLMNVLSALMDFSRWPVQVFEGLWRLVFTFVLPLAVITSFPAMALLDRISPRHTLTSLAVAGVFFALARHVWLRALRGYRSASS